MQSQFCKNFEGPKFLSAMFQVPHRLKAVLCVQYSLTTTTSKIRHVSSNHPFSSVLEKPSNVLVADKTITKKEIITQNITSEYENVKNHKKTKA